MSAHGFTATFIFLILGLLYAESVADEPIDLAGSWTVKLDPDNRGDKEEWFKGFDGKEIELPGICTEAGLGKALPLELGQTQQVFRHLHQRRSYIGATWYQREFEVPENFHLRDAELTLERVLWQSKVWVNGIPVGTQSSLSTAHRFLTKDALRSGRNRIVVCVDNREQVPIGIMGHGYTEQTQTIWNGVVGRLQIKPVPVVSVERLQVFPVVHDDVVHVSVQINNRTSEATSVPIEVGVCSTDETRIEIHSEMVCAVPAGLHSFDVNLPAKSLKSWSEFSPIIYSVFCKSGNQRVELATGFRSLEAANSNILINGKRSFMRGTLDCCIFPKTGYPPTDVETWRKQFRTIKSYGLNHVRFHSWCPPDSAFSAADQLGVYLQVELPNWTDKMGQDKRLGNFLESEGDSILRSYAHHPSFMFFSLGNELEGDFDFVDRMLQRFQSKAKHILMTSTSYSFSERGKKPGPHDQFFVTQQTDSGWIRGQRSLNEDQPETNTDYSEGVSSVSLPVISHEIGQYAVYPNLKEIDKYDGNLRSTALEAIQANLKSKRRLADSELATESSGMLALELYKEEIERAIRTPGQDGFQLLGLSDFSGQSTATVGILDAFWDSKGLVDPKEFRQFCSPTVPLLRIAKRSFKTSEILAAKIQVGHFGPQPMVGTEWQVAVKRHGETLFQKQYTDVDVELGNSIDVGEFEVSLDKILEPSQLTVSVVCKGHNVENSWSVWVYPDTQEPIGNVKLFKQVDEEMLTELKGGASVLLLPERDSILHPIDGRFVPVFWSPIHFPTQTPTHGTVIERSHPVFRKFPTASHTDWQWWELLSRSTAVDMSHLATGRRFPIMRFIDKFNRNGMPAIMWEATVGDGKLFVCSLDVESDLHERSVANALRNSVLSYMNSSDFDPADEITRLQLETIFK